MSWKRISWSFNVPLEYIWIWYPMVESFHWNDRISPKGDIFQWKCLTYVLPWRLELGKLCFSLLITYLAWLGAVGGARRWRDVGWNLGWKFKCSLIRRFSLWKLETDLPFCLAQLKWLTNRVCGRGRWLCLSIRNWPVSHWFSFRRKYKFSLIDIVFSKLESERRNSSDNTNLNE